MSLLTPEEITDLFTSETHSRTPASFARVIESAVIARLASGVALPEPFFWVYEAGTPGGYCIQAARTRKDGPFQDRECWQEAPVFTLPQLQTAIAAARVQALEEAAGIASDGWNSTGGYIEKRIRALIQGETK